MISVVLGLACSVNNLLLRLYQRKITLDEFEFNHKNIIHTYTYDDIVRLHSLESKLRKNLNHCFTILPWKFKRISSFKKYKTKQTFILWDHIQEGERSTKEFLTLEKSNNEIYVFIDVNITTPARILRLPNFI